MRQRGSSVLEILVATAISVTAFLAIVSFFLATLRFGKDTDAQVALQRQGTAIAEELGRRLRQADGSPKIEDPAAPPLTPSCLPLSTNDLVLVIANPDGSATCMYRDTSAPPLVVRCTRPTPTDPCEPVNNLLSGSLVPLSATAWSASVITPCDAADGTCDESGVCSVPNQSCATVPGASVSFTLSDGTNAPATFGVTIVMSRH